MTDAELYARGIATLLASWEAYAAAAPGDAALVRLDGAAAAVFPEGAAREIYNNAVLERAGAIDMMESVYREAGVERYAVWIHEDDAELRAALGARGYAVAESTRAMGRTLGGREGAPAVAVDLDAPDWAEHLRILGVPGDLLAATPPGVRVLVAGGGTATAHALDHDGDCGIYNVTTIPAARRRGLAGALTTRVLHDAAARGCTTASLQSTPEAEGVYAAAGFRDLGRILELVPPRVAVRPHTGSRAELRDLFLLAEDSATQLDAYIDLGRVLVAVDGDAVVGHLQLVDRDTTTTEIINMAVAEDHQGRGIGRTLIESAIAGTRAAGTITLLVATAAADTGNLRFYQRLGFRMLRVERDAFTRATGYPDGIVLDGIPLRDRVWLSLDVG
jgi:ribosomal protein S18 acetylase RimI-like enzyme